MGNERGKHKAWTKAGVWAKGMDWGLSLTVRRCCCRKWHTWSKQPLLYALCARLLQAQSSLFVSFKENRTNWNVLGCYIVIASCLSDSGWKCVRSVIDLYLSLSLSLCSPNTTSVFHYLLISVPLALLITFLVDLRAWTDAFCTLHFPIPFTVPPPPPPPPPHASVSSVLGTWCQLSEESSWFMSTF